MAYTAPTTRASGDLITASIWNTDLVNNISYFKGSPSITALTTSGAVDVGTTLTASTSIVASISSVGSITQRANSTTSVEVHIRPLSGKSGYLSFAEDSVADRWVIHSKTGSGTLGIASGSSSSHTDRVAITSGGNLAIGTTAKIYLDSVAGTGDTYISESASNVLSLYSGGVESKLTSGVLTVGGFGTNAFTAGGTGANVLKVENTTSGTGNYAGVTATAGTSNGYLLAFSQGYTTSGPDVASSTQLLSQGSGGLSVVSSNASGAIRFYTGGTTEAGRFHTAVGRPLLLGITTPVEATYNHRLEVKALNGEYGAVFQNYSTGASAVALAFFNSSSSVMGSILLGADNATTSYNTTSDIRLKTDQGIAVSVDVLRDTVIHDFLWTSSNVSDRGVFAQEAVKVKPRAITVGSDDLLPNGELREPWSVDYSKYVSDLIVGWQQHEKQIAALQARIDALEARLN